MNRFKGLDLVDRVPEELWTEVHNIVQEQCPKPSQRKRNAKQRSCLRKKRSKKQGRKGNIYPTECRVPKNSREIRSPS